MEVVYELAVEMASLVESPMNRKNFEELVSSGVALETFVHWATTQGAEPEWLAAPELAPAPHEVVCEAPRSGFVSHVATRELGLVLAEASHPEGPKGPLDAEVALRYDTRLGDSVTAGQELARLYLRGPDQRLEERFMTSFTIADGGAPPSLIRDRVPAP